jgi:hypothetical protein
MIRIFISALNTRFGAALLSFPALACAAEPDAAAGMNSNGPLYALHTILFDPEFNATSYVELSDTLELDSFSFENAREFAGYAFIAAFDGKLLVSDGESPIITRYDFTNELEWPDGERLGFEQHGVTGGEAGFERHWFQSETIAYLTLGVTGRVVWDPTNFEILGVEEDSELPLKRGGLAIDDTFNRQPRVSDAPVLKPFYYHDEDWFEFGETTLVATYDPVTHAETSIIEVPCPAVEVPSVDEEGNTYLSAWTFGPVVSLYGEGPSLCVRRITPDATLDEAWAPDLTQWTEGRPVKVFRYLRDGKALATVLHTEDLAADFSTPYDPDVDADAESHYRLWLFDLDAAAATPVDGIGAMNSGFHSTTFDERTFVFVPTDDWSATEVYEIDLDGVATRRFDTIGRLSEWIRVR